jgi:alpha-mannosidase
MKTKTLLLLTSLLFSEISFSQEVNPKRLYLGNDTHVDLMYNGTEAEWDKKIVDMADFYLKIGEESKNDADPARRSKWNYDCAYWLYTLERKTSPAYFARIIDQIKRQQASVPYNFTLPIYGAFTSESILRSFYYGGYLERKYDIDVDIAVCQENATIPLGLSSLWAGSGAKYSWKGVCFCATKTKNHGVRDHEMYYYKGLDDQKVLMKWYSILGNNSELGGYSELLEPTVAVWQMDTLTNTKRYPYRIAGAFGKGWDNMVNYSFDMVWHLNHRTKPGTKLFISNELDFFKDFEDTYGKNLPSETVAWGNEWDILPASMVNVTAGIRRSMEKLRSAKTLASFEYLKNPEYMKAFKVRKDAFLYGLSVISAHGWTLDGPVTREQFKPWARFQQKNIEAYVDTLFNTSLNALAKQVPQNVSNNRFLVFNPLSWERDGLAELEWPENENLTIKDALTSKVLEYQFVQKNGKQYLQVLAKAIPSTGYTTIEILKNVIKPKANVKTAFKLENQVFNTPFYVVKFAKNGVLTSIFEKTTKKEWVKTESGKYFNDLGTGLNENGTFRIENVGKLSATLVFESDKPLKNKSSISFYVNSPKIKIENEILQNFGDNQYWTYTLNLENSTLSHEEIGAMIIAKQKKNGGHYADRMGRLDHLSANHFLRLSNTSNEMLVSNHDALFVKLGKSEPQDLDETSGQLNMLIGGQIDKDLKLGMYDQAGDTYFKNSFSFLPSLNSNDNAKALRFSLEDQNPLFIAKATGAAGDLKQSLLSIQNPNIVLWSLKPGEDAGILLRTWNTTENSTESTIQVSKNLVGVKQATHVETPIKTLEQSNNTFKISPKRQEMQSFLLEFK